MNFPYHLPLLALSIHHKLRLSASLKVYPEASFSNQSEKKKNTGESTYMYININTLCSNLLISQTIYYAKRKQTSNSIIAFFILSTSNIKHTKSCTAFGNFDLELFLSSFLITSSSSYKNTI